MYEGCPISFEIRVHIQYSKCRMFVTFYLSLLHPLNNNCMKIAKYLSKIYIKNGPQNKSVPIETKSNFENINNLPKPLNKLFMRIAKDVSHIEVISNKVSSLMCNVLLFKNVKLKLGKLHFLLLLIL